MTGWCCPNCFRVSSHPEAWIEKTVCYLYGEPKTLSFCSKTCWEWYEKEVKGYRDERMLEMRGTHWHTPDLT